jgi:hypothetical protein
MIESIIVICLCTITVYYILDNVYNICKDLFTFNYNRSIIRTHNHNITVYECPDVYKTAGPHI